MLLGQLLVAVAAANGILDICTALSSLQSLRLRYKHVDLRQEDESEYRVPELNDKLTDLDKIFRSIPSVIWCRMIEYNVLRKKERKNDQFA